MVTRLGHVGIICDDLMKTRDFYTRVIGLTVSDEDPGGNCFLTADINDEHHMLALAESRKADHPNGPRPKTQGVGQISFIVKDLSALREFNRRFKKEGTPVLRTVTHGISVSIYFQDPEGNIAEVYYKTGYIIKQGLSRPISLETQSDQEILAFSKSFEATMGPFQGAKLPVAPVG